MGPKVGGVTQDTIDLVNQAIASPSLNPRLARQATPEALKTITVASDVLYGYPLENPSKKLYFVEDAVRRRVPRYLNPTGGKVAHWKVITNINSAKIKAPVAEGAIATSLTLADAEKSATYKTLDQTQGFTDEALMNSRKFEDVPALTMLTALQSLMIQEDRTIIGGNITALGVVGTVTAADSSTAGSLATSTAYDFKVSALTLDGYLNGANGINSAVDSPDETTGTALTTYSTTTNTSVDLTWTAIPGAVAYNIYITLHSGTYKYQKTVTVNAGNVGTIAAGNAANAADQTANAYAFDGIIAQLNPVGSTISSANINSSSSAYIKNMNNATLNADGAAGVTEIEDALASLWNNSRLGPSVILVNAQEARYIKIKVIGGGGTPIVRVQVNDDQIDSLRGGSAVFTYWSPYMKQNIEILTSVHIPPGTMILLAENIPYPNAETPNNLEMDLQQEYWGQPLAKTTRQQNYTVSVMEVLKIYMTKACGIIQGIKPG